MTECPVSFIEPISRHWVSLFWNCHSLLAWGLVQHSLPGPGGLLDQDHATIQAFNLIKAEVLDHLRPKEETGNGK